MTTRKRITHAFVSLLALTLGMAGTSNAALVATDLNTGGTDTGFSSGWAGSSGVGIQNATDLTYANYFITQSGTTARVYNHYPDHPDRMDSRDLASAMSNEVWFSVLVNVPSGTAFAGISFHSDLLSAPSADYSHNAADLRIVMSPTELWVDWQGAALNAAWTADATAGSFTAGATHLVLGKMNVVAGNDTLDVWIDPNLNAVTGPGDLPAADYSNTAVDFTDEIVRIGVPGDDNGLTVSVDAIWLSDTTNAFKEVTGVTGSADTDPPTISTLSPTNGATDVAVDTNLVITFSEPVTNAASGNIVIQQTAGGTFETIPVTSSNITISGSDVTINPTNDLGNSTGYYVEIDSGAFTDFAVTPNDFAGISGSSTWSFVTEILDVTAPTISSLSPVNGATGVGLGTDLEITFDEDVQKGTSGNIVIQQSAGGTFETIPIGSASITVSGADVTINPSSDFTKGAGYYVEIDGGAIEDLAGNDFTGISGSGTWGFQASAGALVAADLNGGGTDIGFSGGWAGSGNVFITDATDLAFANYFITQTGTTERIYASNAAPTDRQDSRALALPMSGEVWFSILVNVPTGGGFAGISFHSTAPSAAYKHSEADVRVLMTPTALLVDLDGGDPPTATGTETGTFTAGTTHLLLGQMNVVAGNDTISIWVDPDLTSVNVPGDLPGANFTSTTVDFTDSITILGVPGYKGTAVEVYMDAIWVSDTATAFQDVTGVSGPDVTAPTLSALSPTNGATDVAVASDLVITFDEDVAKGTNGNIVIQQTAGGTFETIAVTSTSVTVSASNATINPVGVLAGSTGYYVEIDSGAITDLAAASNAFAGISGSGTWSFTTTVADVTAPSISSLSPTNNATGVAAGTDLVITLDENVQKGASGNIVIQQTAGGTFETIAVTSAAVTVSGADVTINPSSNLDGGSNYYVEIDSGAIEDLSGNDFTGISGSGTWSFQVYAGNLVATDLNVGGTDTGFGGAWAGSGNLNIISAADLTYANYGITQTGTTERIYSSNTTHTDRQDSRALGAALSGDVWFSILVNVPSGGAFSGLGLFTSVPSPTYSHVGADARILMSDSQLIVDLDGGALPAGTGSYAAGTDHLLLGQLNVGAGNDTINVWVDPDLTSVSDPGDLPAAQFTSTTVDFSDSIGAIGVPGAIGSASEVYMDAIWLSDRSTAFQDVTGTTGPDTTAPTLSALSPTNGATGVSVASDLVITFDANVQKGGSGNIVIQQAAGGTFETIAVTASNVTVSGADVTINPTSNLASVTGYYVEIDSGAIEDLSSNAFAGISDSNTWSFVTASSDVTAPTVAALSPVNGATGVAVSTDLVISFDENVAKGTNGNIVIQQSAGGTFETIAVTSGAVTVSGTNVTISASSDFTKGAGYYVEIDNGAIEDLAGNDFAGISGSGTWSFEVTPGAFASADFNTGGADTGFSGGWVGSGNVFITTTNDLAYGEYAITQSGSPERVYASNAGPDRQVTRNLATAMAGDVWFSALVRVPSGTTYAGITFSNYGNTYDPVTTEARILMTPSQIQVGFNGGGASTGSGSFAADTTHLLLGQMNVVSGNDTISVWVDPDLTAVTGLGDLPAANYTSTAVDFSDSITSVGVAGRKGAGTEDVHMDAIRVSDRSSGFDDVTGLGVVETTAPTISELSPVNGASDVAVEDDLVITFSEPVKKGSGNIVIQQSAGGTFETIPVGSTAVTLIGGGAVSINPSSDLAGTTGYYVEIASGAFTDFADTPNDFAGITSSGTWSFATELVDITAPTISALSPANGATNVSLNTDLVITFDENVQKGAGGNIVIQQSAGGTFETIAVTSPNVTVSGADVTIDPSGLLAKGAAYYVEIDSGAITDLAPTPNDFAGISGAATWGFTVSSGTLAATDLNTGGTDTGFSGGWAGSNNRFPIASPDLTSARYAITQSGTTTYVYGGNTTAPDRMDSRDLAIPMSGEIWFTVLVDVPAGGGFAGLSFHSDTLAESSADYSHDVADARVMMTPSQLIVDLDGGALPAGTGSFAAGTHLLVGRLTVGAGTDTISVWVDPDRDTYGGADWPAPDYSSTAVDFTDLIVRIGVPINSPADTADAIWLSDTATAFQDVAGPPRGALFMLR